MTWQSTNGQATWRNQSYPTTSGDGEAYTEARPQYNPRRRECDRRRVEAGEMDRRKKRGGEIPKATAIWILSTLILAAISPVSSIDDKCAACNAVAAELEIGLSKEKPRNHLDMRHRLDSRGQREGKVIDYKVSELRVVELLDGLCEKMQDYTLMKLESGQKGWVKVRDWDDLKTDKQEARAYSKNLSSFCGRLLEETEDELTEWIKQGTIEPEGVNKVLCQDLSKHCSSSRGSSNVDDREL